MAPQVSNIHSTKLNMKKLVDRYPQTQIEVEGSLIDEIPYGPRNRLPFPSYVVVAGRLAVLTGTDEGVPVVRFVLNNKKLSSPYCDPRIRVNRFVGDMGMLKEALLLVSNGSL